MKQYPQLSKEKRYTIYLYLKSGFSYREIAGRLGRSHSTISREVSRNEGLRAIVISKHNDFQRIENTDIAPR